MLFRGICTILKHYCNIKLALFIQLRKEIFCFSELTSEIMFVWILLNFYWKQAIKSLLQLAAEFNVKLQFLGQRFQFNVWCVLQTSLVRTKLWLYKMLEQFVHQSCFESTSTVPDFISQFQKTFKVQLNMNVFCCFLSLIKIKLSLLVTKIKVKNSQ